MWLLVGGLLVDEATTTHGNSGYLEPDINSGTPNITRSIQTSDQQSIASKLFISVCRVQVDSSAFLHCSVVNLQDDTQVEGAPWNILLYWDWWLEQAIIGILRLGCCDLVARNCAAENRC
jgi:hypothetical protein